MKASTSATLRAIASLISKDLRLLLRDRGAVFLTFAWPLVLALLPWILRFARAGRLTRGTPFDLPLVLGQFTSQFHCVMAIAGVLREQVSE